MQEAIARTPISSESPLNITSSSAAAPAVAASGKGKGSQLDCGDADNKMREQLSSKLMAPNEARHDARNLMTANDFNSHAQKSVSCKTGGGPQSRKHGSVSSSPRYVLEVYNRLCTYVEHVHHLAA